ncbi:hypothetical protein ACFX1Q_030094 [Malus domestica]
MKQTNIHGDSNRQLRCGDEDAIAICIQPFSFMNPDSSNIDRNMLLATITFDWSHRTSCPSSHTNLTSIYLINISDAPIYHNPRPTHNFGTLCQYSSGNGTPQASFTINNQNPTLTFRCGKLYYQSIVFKHLDRHNGA